MGREQSIVGERAAVGKAGEGVRQAVQGPVRSAALGGAGYFTLGSHLLF